MEPFFITALDLGSSTFKMSLAEYDENNNLYLICSQKVASQGIKKGAITNMEQVIEAIIALRMLVIEESGLTPLNCYVSYSSENIEATNSDGVMAIDFRGKGRIITEEDKLAVIKQAQAIPIDSDKAVAHIIPLQYIVDNQDFVTDPVNMVGVRLKAVAHILIANASLLENISLAVKRAGLSPTELIYSTISASQAILSHNERDSGTIFIDIGGATTKISFYQKQVPFYDAILPIGGATLTNDLAYMLKIPFEVAETIKVKHGCCFKFLLEREDFAFLPGSPDKRPEPISEHYICDILTARMNEIFLAAYQRLAEKGWLARAEAIVIGGGGGELPGCAELATKIFKTPARTGYVMGFENLSDEHRSCEYGAVYGLLKENDFKHNRVDMNEKKDALKVGSSLSKKKMSKTLVEQPSKIKQWFKDLF